MTDSAHAIDAAKYAMVRMIARYILAALALIVGSITWFNVAETDAKTQRAAAEADIGRIECEYRYRAHMATHEDGAP